jgi:molecular chaperone GrpE (heat shock protein)
MNLLPEDHGMKPSDVLLESEISQSIPAPSQDATENCVPSDTGANDVDVPTSSEKDEKPATTEPASIVENSPDPLAEICKCQERVESKLDTIVSTSTKTTVEVHEMHKLYHNEFAGRLKSMQEELERYREVERGRVYDGILGELAKFYSDNIGVTDEIEDGKASKRLRYMFLDMLQLLESNNVCTQKSRPGEKRNARHCQVVERVTTDDPELHDTVAKSHSTGFYIENRTLVKELVDVFIYTPGQQISA